MTNIVITTGGRNYADYNKVKEVLDSMQPELIIVGDATGADALVLQWATERKVDYLRCFADWNLYGKSAGPIRNKTMIHYGELFLKLGNNVRVLAFPGGKGTESCKSSARMSGLIVVESEND